MSNDILAGRWKRMRGSVKEQWGNFTVNALDRTEGKLERRLRDDEQKHIASALRARRMNKRQSIGW
jgi:hypothetical protein